MRVPNVLVHHVLPEAAIVRRLEMAKKRYEEGDVISYRLSKNRRGQFALSWKIDDAAGLLLILSWT